MGEEKGVEKEKEKDEERQSGTGNEDDDKKLKEGASIEEIDNRCPANVEKMSSKNNKISDDKKEIEMDLEFEKEKKKEKEQEEEKEQIKERIIEINKSENNYEKKAKKEDIHVRNQSIEAILDLLSLPLSLPLFLEHPELVVSEKEKVEIRETGKEKEKEREREKNDFIEDLMTRRSHQQHTQQLLQDEEKSSFSPTDNFSFLEWFCSSEQRFVFFQTIFMILLLCFDLFCFVLFCFDLIRFVLICFVLFSLIFWHFPIILLQFFPFFYFCSKFRNIFLNSR